MFVTNKDVFGYLVSSPEDLHTLEEARQEFINFKLKTLGEAVRGGTRNVGSQHTQTLPGTPPHPTHPQ